MCLACCFATWAQHPWVVICSSWMLPLSRLDAIVYLYFLVFIEFRRHFSWLGRWDLGIRGFVWDVWYCWWIAPYHGLVSSWKQSHRVSGLIVELLAGSSYCYFSTSLPWLWFMISCVSNVMWLLVPEYVSGHYPVTVFNESRSGISVSGLPISHRIRAVGN